MIGTRSVAVIGAVLTIAGCSSKPAEPSAPEPPTSSHGNLSECLHAHGVPDSAGPAAVLGPPDGIDPAVWDQAMTACSTLAPGPGP